jgi:hypothetical protein
MQSPPPRKTNATTHTFRRERVVLPPNLSVTLLRSIAVVGGQASILWSAIGATSPLPRASAKDRWPTTAEIHMRHSLSEAECRSSASLPLGKCRASLVNKEPERRVRAAWMSVTKTGWNPGTTALDQSAASARRRDFAGSCFCPGSNPYAARPMMGCPRERPSDRASGSYGLLS